MARAQTPTLLALDRYASILGIAPVHFNGGKGASFFPDTGDCQDIWPQYSWQGPTVISREDLASAISDAENDIRQVLGFPIAPTYIVGEVVPYPHFYDPAVYSPARNAKGLTKSIVARNSHILALGVRKMTAVDLNAPVLLRDLDGDNFYETAEVIVSTTVTNPQEIKVYFSTHGADPAWEIRPISTLSIAGGVATIRFASWLIFDPALTDAIPTTDGFSPVDIQDETSYEIMVDVYREQVDNSQTVQFNYTDYAQSPVVSVSQAGTGTILNAEQGLITPHVTLSPCYGEPDSVTLWYKAGEVDEKYQQGLTLDPLPNYWAQAIVWLATARLKLPICACSPVQDLVAELQRNVLQVDRSRNTIFSIITPEMITNPFGTRVGEIRAWDRVARVSGDLSLGSGAW